MNTFVVIVIAIVAIPLLLLLVGRRRPAPRDIASALSSDDRRFLADEIEPITRMPTNTAGDVSAWYDAVHETEQRLGARFPDVGSVLASPVNRFFADGDVHRKKPSYRARLEPSILEFIKVLRDEIPET